MPERNDDLRASGKLVSEEIDFSLICHPGEAPPCICRPKHIRDSFGDNHRDVEPSFFQTILSDLRNLCFGKRGC